MTEDAKVPTETPHWQSELLTLYQVAAQDLAFFKQQQWAVTNYVLLLDAALIGATQLPNVNATSPERLGICLVSVVLGLAGVRLLFMLERSIAVGRDRLRNIREQLSPEFRAAWFSPNKADQSREIALLLGAALAAGTATVWWVVWLKRV